MQREPKRNCPIDGTEMSKILSEPTIMLDVCPKCQGMWIDGHEREMMLNALKQQGAQNAIVQGYILGSILSNN